MNRLSHSKRKWLSRYWLILQFTALSFLLSHYNSLAFAQFPTHSSPIDITPDDRFVWVVNPDNNCVSVFNVQGDANTKIQEILVGKEPQSVAIHPLGTKAYVTNMVSGTVWVIAINPTSGAGTLCKIINVGTEPYGVAVAPNGLRAFVTNASSDTVTVIDTTDLAPFGSPVGDLDCTFGTDAIVDTIPVADDPRGLAITADSARVFVTHMFAQLRPGKTSFDEGRDDSREGRVTAISTFPTYKVLGTIALNPLLDTGFRADGSTIDRIPCSVAGCAPPAGTGFVTGAFPNLMQSITIKGNRAYLPNTAASPNGPVRFNVNVQSFLSVFDITTGQDSGQTINMNRGIQNESDTTRLFITNPFAIAFKRSADEGYVTAKAINQIIRVTLDANGTPTINAPTPVRVNVGKDPRGIVFNSTDTRAYVMNYVSRDMTVVDISTGTPSVIGTFSSAALPPPGSFEEVVQRGKELFNTAIGPAGTTPTSDPPAGRMSSEGWGSCFGCHEDGRTDSITWMFPDGPRQVISMDASQDPQVPPEPVFTSPNGQRVLNFSATRDEIQDFELNIRNVSGGQGLIADGQPVVNLTPTANTGRSSDLDALATFIRFGVRSRIAPKLAEIENPTTFKIRGRKIFREEGCDTCHGGSDWTRSLLDFTPPPPSTELIVDTQLIRFLSNVGTFDIDLFEDGKGNEIRSNTVGTNVQARGLDGFNPPSLLGVFATAPYFHNGSALTLEEVIVETPRHPADVHVVSNPFRRAALIRFLKTIDESTAPITPSEIPVPPVPTPTPIPTPTPTPTP